MKQLRIKDNKLRAKEDFYEIKNLVKVIADRTLQQLEKEGVFVFPEIIKDSEDMDGDQMILQSVNDTFRAGNVMGFLGLGDERLIIESRFSLKEDFLFQYLLERVLNVPNIVNFDIDENRDNRLYNIFLFLFPRYLKAAVRKGAFKTYVKKQYNDDNIRGPIDVARYIRKNIPFTGAIAYNQREYDFDNYLMELVRHTVEFLKAKPYGNKLLFAVKEEVELIKKATPNYRATDRRRVIEENKTNVVRHAFYHEYRDLQHLCILILQNEKHQMGEGSRQIYGVLFDGAWLWEEYINQLVKDQFHHPKNKEGRDGQWLFNGKNGKGLIYPDFIGRDNTMRIVADAKYKPDDNIRNKDYLQVLSYMFRFDSKKAFYFYPEVNDDTDQEFYLNSGTSFDNDVIPRNDIRLIKHGLKIPYGTETYSEFVNRIHDSENEFMKLICDRL